MADQDPRAPKFPVIVKHPTYDDVRGNFSGNDYLQWGGVTAVSFPLGYVFGTTSYSSELWKPRLCAKLNPRVARPSMWVTGLLGSLGGFLWAYQNSSFRLQGYAPNRAEVKRFIRAPQEE
ncbi:putative mitochondrial protein, partial [Globisporangium splendens]